MPRLGWPRGGLWRHPDFLKLWSAETVSQFGTQVSLLAIPLAAVIVLDATAFQVAALGTVEFLPFLLFTLPAGVWVDRLPRRPILVVGDFGRAFLLASIPLAYLTGHLTLAQLYLVGFATGICTVFFDVAYQSYLPSLVEREQIIDGNSKLEISRSAAQIGGPGLGGVLVQLLTAPYAILADAVSFIGSGAFIFSIRKQEEWRTTQAATAQAEKSGIWGELKEGLSFVLDNRNLRAQAGCTATSNFFSQFTFAIIIVFLVRTLGLSAGVIGLAFSLGSVGALLAALTATRISGRFGIGPTTMVSIALFGPSVLLIAFAPTGNSAIPFLVLAQLVIGFSVVVYNIVQVSYRQAICPPRLQGRMNSVMRFIVWGTIPLGTLTGGALASSIGLRQTMVIGAIGGSLAVLWIVFSPQRHLREMPEPVSDEPRETDLVGTVPALADTLAADDAAA
jgi:MFS family permease